MVAHARQLDTQHPLLLPRKLEIVPVPLPPPPPPRPLLPSLPPALAAKLTSGAELVRSLARQRREEVIPTTFAAVDALLGGGLARGKVTELAGRGARWSMVVATLAAATSMGEAAALVDVGDHLDPQLAEAAGVDLRRLLWVRPKTLKDAVTAAEMLGATGFQFVVLDAGLPPLRGRRLPDAAWVRLARTCETHGCTLLVSSPYALTGTTSEAMLLAHRARPRWLGSGKSPRVLAGVEMTVRLEKHRRIRPGQSVKVFLAEWSAVVSTAGPAASRRGDAETASHQPARTPALRVAR